MTTDARTEPTPDESGVLRALPRRKPIASLKGDAQPERNARLVLPVPSFARTVVRLVAWVVVALRVLLTLRPVDRLEPPERAARARRLREIVQAMGPFAVKIGLQVAWRFDLVSTEVALELAHLDDRMEPFALTEASARIESAAGRTMREVFRVFDPHPISSTVLACEYQAETHDGRKVVVKVRRPGVRRNIAAEVYALRALLGVAEWFALARGGFFTQIEQETEAFLLEEADFRVQARFQNIFRQRAKRDRLKFVTAARVYTDILSDSVMVSEFVSGVWLGEVVAAQRSGDPSGLVELARRGVEPKKLARDLLQTAWWELHENLFFHSEPAVRDVVVEPGGRLVFVRFSDCSTASNRLRQLKRELYRRLDQDDVSGATDVLVRMVSPLPFIDVYDFTKAIEGALWHHLFALRDPDSSTGERTSTSLWLSLFQAVRKHGVPVRVEVVRIARASVMFDALALTLDPGLRPLKEFRRFERRADLREARRFVRDAREVSDRDLRPLAIARFARLSKLLQRGVYWLESAVDAVSVPNLSMVGKAATVALLMLGYAVTVLAGTALAVALTWGALRGLGRPVTPAAAWEIVAGHPLWYVFLVVRGLVSLRQMAFRLRDTDPV